MLRCEQENIGDDRTLRVVTDPVPGVEIAEYDAGALRARVLEYRKCGAHIGIGVVASQL